MSNLADAGYRRMIEERLDLNMLVEAGAGSGKTHSLASRMAAGIVSGRYEVEEMAAVTFTRKAAAELRGRFQLALEGRLAGAGGDERARIEKALAGLEHLFAGTIHSFCAHLLRERPVEAGIAPGFTELDEFEDEEFRQRAWRDYLAGLRSQQPGLLLELQHAGVRPAHLDKAFRIVCTFDEVEFPPGNATAPDAAAARTEAEAFWRALQELMPPRNRDAKCATLAKAYEFGGMLRSARKGRTSDLAEALRCWEKPPAVTMKWWAEEAAAQRAVREKVQQLVGDFQAGTVAPFLSAWRQYVYRLSVTLLAGAREFAREERRRALALDYGDLLSAAAALLRGNPPVRRAMQRKYRWLLVDEFQDTDPIQADVMLLLAADEESGGGIAVPDPYAVRLRPGALFVVGDPKQSIYRFRRADIDVYTRVRGVIRANEGVVVPLTTSFRAKPSLCDWNNRAFGTLLPEEATAQQATFSPLEADPGWKPARGQAFGDSGLRVLLTPESVAKGDVPAEEAGEIAQFIRGEVDAGRASWGDFLLLARTRRALGVYASTLQALDIPTEVSGAGAFGDSSFVRALVDLLRALGDPGNAPGVVGVLRGPLFGVSDAELFAHHEAGGRFAFSAARTEAEAGASRTEAALARLGGFLRLTRSLPLPAAVERIIEEAGFAALAAASGVAASPAGDVLHVVDLARAVAEDGGSLADAADALDEAAESSDVESVPLEPGRRDVVRVMNLHKAKGLEARVVFLVDPAGAPGRTVDVRIVREGATARGYLGVSRPHGEYHEVLIAHPAEWEAHAAAELEYLTAEETRLLYVAATRARELLVVSRWEKERKGERPWEVLAPFLDGAEELEVASTKAGGARATVDLSAKARRVAAEAREVKRTAACAPTWAVTSMTGGEHAAAGGGSTTAGPGVGREPVRLDAGAGWGSLVHGLLEYAGRRPEVTRADLERLAGWLVHESSELEAVVPAAVSLVETLARTPIWREVRESGEVHVEVPFAVRVAPGESFGGVEAVSLPTVVQGVIDLVHRSGDGWRILDYKTDLADDEASLTARHGAQLATYRAAWERTTGEAVREAGIVALRSLTVVPV